MILQSQCWSYIYIFLEVKLSWSQPQFHKLHLRGVLGDWLQQKQLNYPRKTELNCPETNTVTKYKSSIYFLRGHLSPRQELGSSWNPGSSSRHKKASGTPKQQRSTLKISTSDISFSLQYVLHLYREIVQPTNKGQRLMFHILKDRPCKISGIVLDEGFV